MVMAATAATPARGSSTGDRSFPPVLARMWHGCPFTDGQPSRSPSSQDRATAWLREEAPSLW